MRYCQYCGMPMEDDDLFCTRCGKAAKGIQKETRDREAGRSNGRGPEKSGGARMGYVSDGGRTGMAADQAEPGKRKNASGSAGASDFEVYDEYDEYEEEERGRKRMILIISGLAIVVVIGVLVGLLLTPPGGKDGDTARQAAVSTDDSAGQGENTASGQVNMTAESNDAGKETKDSGEDKAQKSDEKESGQQAGEPDETAERGNEKKAAEEKKTEAREESEENRGSAAVKTEQNEELAEGIEELEKTEQADQENEEAAALDSSYILPDSNSRLYSREELERMDNYTLQMAINEIYARHGRKFKTDSIREYFEGKSWYRGTIEPEAFDGNEGNYFNDYESANRELMARIRASREEKTTGSGEKNKTTKGN